MNDFRANSPITATHSKMNKPIAAWPFKMTKCKKCGKELVGVSLDYGGTWFCRKCAQDSSTPSYSETGDKIICYSIDNGRVFDVQQAHKYLKKDKIYTIDSIAVHGYSTDITLQKIPNVKFNSVYFIQYNEPAPKIKITQLEQYFEYLNQMCDSVSDCSKCDLNYMVDGCESLTQENYRTCIKIVQNLVNNK